MSIAGHISPKMLTLYSHIRLKAKRKALDALGGNSEKSGYDTNNDTKPLRDAIPKPQVIEKYGRPVGTRTPDLYRVKVPLIGFTTTYKTAGTAKVRGSSYKTYFLWVGLWVEKKPANSRTAPRISQNVSR